ncbi:Malonyl CoA-acyl carrier protein transacylase [Minicystis rosea]|nr:Malonyl CoA-acyl carrier protein transacylase [Minicystis rosea]
MTRFMTLLAAFEALLHRHTGQTDLLIGTPIANRTQAATEKLCGFFLNTLVLRAELTPDLPFRDLLHRVRETALAAYAHQDLPFERLVQELAPERDRSRSPLFQVMFTLQNASSGTFTLPGLECAPASAEIHTSKFDLTLILTDHRDTITGFFEYATDLFDAPTIERLAAHYLTLLSAAVTAPETPLHALPLLSETEHKQVLVDWNDTAFAHPHDKLLHELFAEQAARSPDAIALRFEGRELTYRQLDQRANKLAHALQKQGIGPDSLVAVFCERSIELVLALYAILEAGGAYVPLDPDYPKDRLAFMLDDAKPSVILTQAHLAERLPTHSAHLFRLDHDWHLLDPEPDTTPPRRDLGLQHLAYVIYTSGSTGKPKGAMNAHGAVLNRLLWMQRHFRLTSNDSILQKTPYSFDVSVWELFWPLLNGATLVIARPDGHRDPAYLAHTIREERITTLHFVPSMLAAFLDEQVTQQCSSLKRVICSGEALSPAIADRFFELLPGLELHNLYGPTECAVDVTAWACKPGDATIPIGKPIDNTKIYILDNHLQPTPIGVPGQLYISGIQVGRGYLNRDALTAERFLPDPFAPNARMYKSGDIARWREDGTIEYLGRADFQVKIRGLRIELGEVEAALLAHPAIREAAVLAREDEPGRKRLVAYLVGDSVPGAAELRAFLQSTLPEHMIPAAFVTLSAMPLTANGKLDRRALPAPETTVLDETGSADAAPTSPTEEMLSQIWAGVLRLPRVGTHDNFFEIGGDSILGIQIVARARQAGIALSPRMIFQHQTIADLARVAGSTAHIEAEQGPMTGPVPHTPIQRWWLEREPRGPSHFNQAFLLAANEPLDPAALADTIAALVEHHDALRVRLVKIENRWEQSFAPPGVEVPFAHVDLAHLAEGAREAALETALARAQTSLDLTHGPALRFVLFDLGAGRGQRLFAVIHHLAVDGVSWRILFEDLESAYTQRRRGAAPTLRAKTTSFQRWAERLIDHAQSETVLAESAHWATLPPPVRLPLDHVTGDDTEASAKRVTVELSTEETTALLREVPEAYGTQINDALLTALAEAIAAWTGSPDVLVDLEGHGREEVFAGVDVTRTVGWFTTLFPVALRLDPSMPPGERLKAIKEQLRAVPNRGLGYGLLRHLGSDDIVSALASKPPAEILFNYLGQVDQVLPETSIFHLTPEPIGPLQSPDARRSHLLEIVGRIAKGKLSARWTYSAHRHHADTITRLAQRFIAALRALIHHASSPDAGGYTPSDFPRTRLTQSAIDTLAKHVAGDAVRPVPRHKNIEDVLPLSPLQQGILYHTMLSARRDTYVVSIDWSIAGALDVPAFTAAWQAVVDRHSILRTALAWEGLDGPVQVVRRTAHLPIEHLDLRGLAPADQETRIDRFLADDRRRGFDITRAPLLRLTLLRLRDDAYRLVWSMHHLILDGWSLPRIVREALAHYEAHHTGARPISASPRPYSDYIDWLAAQDRARAQAFWQAQLHDVTAPTPLCIDRPASSREEERFGEARHALSQSDTAAISAFARKHRLTASTLVQAAWALLLARYSGENDVLFGATVSGRSAPIPGIDSMVGLFINTIPVRVRVPRDESVVAWLTALQAQQTDLREFEHTPLADAQAQSGIPRGTPLFESLVVFENYPVDDTLSRDHAGISVIAARAFETPAYPLTIIAVLRRTLTFRIGYDARRFDTATVDRLCEHLTNILRGLVSKPDALLRDLSPLSDAERKRLLIDWNDTVFAHPQNKLIHELFAEQAARSPDAIALRFEGRELTYRQLDQRANKLAHALQKQGIGPDSLVAVFCERSLELVLALYAILEAGGAYVPLDPDYPKDRLAFMLDDAKPRVILTQAHLADRLPAHSAHLFRLDHDWHLLDPEPDTTPPRRDLGLQHLAYVIYTSGSTGKPKGAMNAHGAILNRLLWMQRHSRLTSNDSILQKTPYSFDVSVWELFWPLLNGATLVVARPDGHRDPTYLARTIQEERITTLHFVPSMLTAFLDEKVTQQCSSLKRVICSGEALSPAIADRFFELLPGVELHNLYGPTECAVDVTAWACKPGDAAIPIGKPIDNTKIYILDNHLQATPIGVPGQLYIAGCQVGRGYLNRDALTTERFLPDPFAPNARMYKSGDIARWREDGTIDYLGRADFQVKIRGLRIELGEIEAALLAHPAIREAVVLAREDEPGCKQLVAYFVSTDTALREGDLTALLSARLPAYMVPSVFVRLPALPLTASGKIDRRALPKPDDGGAVAGRVAPRGPIEEAIASIFAEVLGAPWVSAHDDFFALGGHSLTATRAVTRIRSALGIDLALRAIFEAPTPAELGARVAAARATGDETAPPDLVRVPRDEALVPSFGQERLWFLHQLDPEDPSYGITLTLRFGGRLDVNALERALSEIVCRHEVLRTSLVSSEGRPVPRIHEEVSLALPVTRWASLPSEDRDDAIVEEARAEMKRPFDLGTLPVRARLVALDADDHVLFLGLHHIVFDAWSQGVLHRELGALYEAFHAGAPSPLAALPIQYVDYAAWQRRTMAGEALERQLAHWKEQLAGAPAALDLPTDRPRPKVRSSRGAGMRFSLGAELTRAVEALARREGVTLFMTLLAAFDVLLARYSGQDDIVVGSPIAGRTRAETEGLIGFFLNTLVLRTKLDGADSFRDLLHRVRAACLGAYAHQDMPFERLVQELHPDPDPSRSPVFQVIFNLQNTPEEPLVLPDLTITKVPSPSLTVKVDLTLIMAKRADSLLGFIEYSTDLFDPSTIERLTVHFRTLLEGIADDAARPLAQRSLLPSDERRRVLHTWNETRAPYPAGETIHGLFEAQVAKRPDAIAVVAGEARVTYRDLDSRANRLARHLQSLGVGPDTVVGLCLPRSAEMVVGLLGILEAGGAYVPLDPAHPHKRLAQILAEAGATVVVTMNSLAGALPEEGIRCVRLDGDAAILDQESDTRPNGGAGPGNLVYVLFTSGSTGKPKGVAIEHRNLVNYVRGIAERLALPEDARYAHVSTFSADLGNTVLFPPLCLGGTLHVIDEALTTDPEGLADYFDRERIDCLKIVPSHLSALLSGTRPEKVLPQTCLVLGGEASSWELLDRIERLAPRMRVMNHYGPTETTVGAIAFPVEKSKRPPTAIVPLGRPLPNTRIYVLDATRNPVPIGVPGEVYIGGAGVARGYLGRPDLTAERFLPDPFVTDPEARMYRTGDRARALPDGTLVFLGRADHQVKIRGFRVELGEIEAALSAHGGAREAVVLVHEETPGDKRLVACVVPRDGERPAPEDIKSSLGSWLPEHMVPAVVHVLEAMPLNANGKIDRQALSALETTFAANDYVAPRTPTEELLASIWADVFERDRIGVHDRFADLGGHSLLAIQIVARAGDAFQTEIPLRAIFEAPTIAGLAERIEIALREDRGTVAPPIVPVPRDRPLPLSFSQERLWFLDQLDPGSAAYNVPIGMRLTGPLDPTALENALHALVRRHEVLRTTFATVSGKPVQVIHEEMPLHLATVDLTPLPEAERESVAHHEAEIEARRPFDLAVGPLFRARLFRISARDHVVLLTLHHIVSDAWTRGILSHEIAALYDAAVRGEPHALPDLPVQYADYAVWQRSFLSGAVEERLLDHWRAQLAGAPAAIELPTDRPRAPVPSGRGARHVVDLPSALARALADLGRRENATLFMTALAAFYVLLQRHTHQDDISVGTPVANRTRAETEGLLGFFVNTLVLRTVLSSELSFRDLVRRVRDVAIAGYAHQEMPFERLVNALAPDRDLSRTPLFQVMFTLQNEPLSPPSLSGLHIRPFGAAGGTAKFDLLLAMTQSPKALHTIFEYSTDLFDASTIERMMGHLRMLLESAVADPDRRLFDLPMLPDAERHLVLSLGSPAAFTRSARTTLPAWFERQVDATPDAPAASFEGRTSTYRELDARANQVAHHLKKLGVGPEVLVGLCVERSLDMLIGMLGILKAGGAYLPLDPEYPQDRLAFMIEDAKVPVVITQSRVAHVLPDHGAKRVLLDEDAPSIAAEPTSRPAPSITPESLAYVIYTSGSTGKPKGAMVTHDNVAHLFEATDAWYRFGPSDVWTMFHSYAFDFSIWEIWGALLYGGRVVIVPFWVSRNPEAFYALLNAEGVTVLNQTPSAFRQLVRVDESMSPETRAALRLRYVIFGGEALDLGDLRPWWDRHGDATPALVNMYGITETTVHVTYRPVRRADLERPWSSVIGRALPDLQIYILDAHRTPVPIGVTGEMYVGGAGVSRGYLDRPELTAERFLPNPFGEGRLYKTGDLGRLLASGDIEYLGRIDHQVKIRGFRIELGEIEAVLDTHPAVRESVVLAREDEPGEKRLVAYLVLRAGAAPTIADLRAFVKHKLPDVMVPAAFVLLDALPLTDNGKVDRRALPAPEEGERAATGTEYVAPEGRVEDALAAIWAAVLRLEKVSVRDNFFELGGDSILSIQIVTRAAEAGITITPRQIFLHQTIAELATAAGTTSAVEAEQGPVTGPVLLTPVQRWWLDQDPVDPHHHNQAMFLSVRDPLDGTALAAAVSCLCDHHDMLRVRLTREEGLYRQEIAPPVDLRPWCVSMSPASRAGSGPRRSNAKPRARRRASISRAAPSPR